MCELWETKSTRERVNKMSLSCVTCGKRAYSDYCVQHKPRKPIPQRGKRAIEYTEWRDTVAKPFLNDYYGYKCATCGVTQGLDVNHKKKRGSHPELIMDLNNVEYLCRLCHIRAT